MHDRLFPPHLFPREKKHMLREHDWIRRIDVNWKKVFEESVPVEFANKLESAEVEVNLTNWFITYHIVNVNHYFP